MTHQRPAGEAMSREGKGTAAAGEAGNSRPIRWEDFEERLTKGGWFWLATVRPNGAPHVMPLFAVWSESALYVASKGTAKKSRNLAADGRCVITTDAGDMHLSSLRPEGRDKTRRWFLLHDEYRRGGSMSELGFAAGRGAELLPAVGRVRIAMGELLLERDDLEASGRAES